MATTETQLNNARTTAARVSSADDNAVANMVEQIGVSLSRLFGAGIFLDTDLNGTLSGGTGIAISPGLAILGTAGHELPWPLLSTKTLSFVASPAGAGQLLFVPSTANQILYISRELETDGFPKFVLSGGVYTHPILTFTTGVATITSVVSNFPAGRVNIMGTRRVLNTSTDRQAGYLASKLLAGTGVSLTTGAAGANETLTAALASIAANSLLGNNTGGAAVPSALTVAQVATLLSGTTGSTLCIGNDSRFTTLTTRQHANTSDTVVLADAGGRVQTTNASAITETIPTHASVAYPTGSIIEFNQSGAGQITIAAAGGVTLHSPGALVKTSAQYATISAIYEGSDVWTLSGSLA